MLVSGRAVSFCPWVAPQSWRSTPTSTTIMKNSSSWARSCSGPTLTCPAATKNYTAATFSLKDRKNLLACGSAVTYDCLCVCVWLFYVIVRVREQHHRMSSSSPRVCLTILSGSTVMWTIMLRALSSSLSGNSSRLSSASGAVRPSTRILKGALLTFMHISPGVFMCA